MNVLLLLCGAPEDPAIVSLRVAGTPDWNAAAPFAKSITGVADGSELAPRERR